MIVSGEDGTIYQVAGKNAEGQTILIAQGVDGEQQRVYVAACDDDLGLESAMSQDGGDDQFMVKQEDRSDPTQALTIVTDSGDSQDITAEVVQADEPSPGEFFLIRSHTIDRSKSPELYVHRSVL